MGSKNVTSTEKVEEVEFAIRAPTGRLSERDRAIITALLAQPQAEPKRVAEMTRIPVDTVRRRLNALAQRGALRQVTLVSRQFTGHEVRAMISIDVDPRGLRSKPYGYSTQEEFCRFVCGPLRQRLEFREFTASVNVESISVVLGGRCDLVAFVTAPDAGAVCEFITRVLRFLPGVHNTNTAFLFGKPV
jgi:DNA-binding Lrp family transcriptional regulator